MPLGRGRRSVDLADRIRQLRDLLQALGHLRHGCVLHRQAVDEGRIVAGAAGRLEVVAVRRR